MMVFELLFLFKRKTAYEVRISDWSSDVCSSDLIEQLETAEAGRRIEVSRVVTHRQRPHTAGGVTFLNLEDETGILNVVAGQGVWKRYRRAIGRSSCRERVCQYV